MELEAGRQDASVRARRPKWSCGGRWGGRRRGHRAIAVHLAQAPVQVSIPGGEAGGGYAQEELDQSPLGRRDNRGDLLGGVNGVSRDAEQALLALQAGGACRA